MSKLPDWIGGKCPDCGANVPGGELVERAARLMAEVNPYGNLHVFVDDGNLEDDWFEEGAPQRSIDENIAGASPEELLEERKLVGLLSVLTEAERFAAYGCCAACLDREAVREQARIEELNAGIASGGPGAELPPEADRRNGYTLPPGYYLRPRPCPACGRPTVEVDRVEGLPIYSCPAGCGRPAESEEPDR